MNKKKRAALALAVVVLAVAPLAGCGNAGTTSSGSSINVLHVDLGEGRTVTCVAVGGSSVDCDWDALR